MGRIAVIGSGIAGLGAAWALDGAHDVVVYEADDRAGGHAHTVDVADEGGPVAVDTGFIVYNEANYPNLTRLFDALRVRTEPSDMSFAVSVGHRFEFQSRAARMFIPPTNAVRPQLWHMLGEFRRFCREAPDVMASGTRESLGSFLERRGYHPAFCANLLLPMTAAIWSCGVGDVRAFPVTTLLAFFSSHGMLQIGDRPAWRTVAGGSTEYVARLTVGFRDRIRLSTPVVSVRRDDASVSVRDLSGRTEVYDHIVFATHADTTLRILGSDATARERATLGAFGFTANTAVLHRDPSLMPKRRAVWASWNYLSDAARRPQGLTYWMNRLQNLHTRRPVFVTLNPAREPRGASTRFSYSHPRLDRAAVDAQAMVPALQGVRRSWFAGAWTRYGFHEDGLRSGLSVAKALGAPAPWGVRPEPVPALVRA